MDRAVLEAQVGRITEVADALRMKSNHEYNDALEDLAEELQDIANTINDEVG